MAVLDRGSDDATGFAHDKPGQRASELAWLNRRVVGIDADGVGAPGSSAVAVDPVAERVEVVGHVLGAARAAVPERAPVSARAPSRLGNSCSSWRFSRTATASGDGFSDYPGVAADFTFGHELAGIVAHPLPVPTPYQQQASDGIALQASAFQ